MPSILIRKGTSPLLTGNGFLGPTTLNVPLIICLVALKFQYEAEDTPSRFGRRPLVTGSSSSQIILAEGLTGFIIDPDTGKETVLCPWLFSMRAALYAFII